MHGNDSRRRTDVAVPLLRFALAGLLAVVVVGAIAVALQRDAARDDAIQDATALAKLAGHAVLQPAVNQALIDGDPQQILRVNRLVESKLRNSGIVRIKVWDSTGRVVYSDKNSLIGRHFELPGDEKEAFETGEVKAELTHLKRAENRFDGLKGKLLEVYLPITSVEGGRCSSSSTSARRRSRRPRGARGSRSRPR
jgi:hypothetical protein